MERFVLFIREPGVDDLADIHPDKSSAQRALADYVRRRAVLDGTAMSPDDDEAIAAWFDDGNAVYAIARVIGFTDRPGNDQ